MAPAKLGLSALAAVIVAAGLYVAIAPSCAPVAPAIPVQQDPPNDTASDTHQAVTISGQTFSLELALTDAARFQGLSDRRSIPEDGGMLFVHPNARVLRFVMRRCYVPIDIIYLDEQGTIVAMHAMQVIEPVGGEEWFNPTRSYSSNKYAMFAIELKGGTLESLGLSVGDVVDLPLEDLKVRAR